MDVDLSKLPLDIRRQIPLSLRTYKSVYVFEELPVVIQFIIKDYFEKELNVNYKVSFDIKPEISKYSDFETFDNVSDLIAEYLKNNLLIVPETYPFDPRFGSRLKNQVQTRDVSVRQMFVSTEINNIVKAISMDTGVDVTIESVEIVPISMSGLATELSASILLKINNDQKKKINIDFVGPT
jgi:hypothetical protein